ncbi:MAG: polysaccharide deacetylase [SAR202 cluster bacterium]|nr:polysaccharide deacetylase [SAR202 cluster bacterium]
MSIRCRPGMDHPHYDYSPIVERPSLKWPDGARVAVMVIINLEHMEWRPPEGSYQPPSLTAGIVGGSGGTRPFPDYSRFSHREYGHRVGVFRLLAMLKRHNIPATIAMDALTAKHYPYLVRHCLEQGCEIIGHGISASRMITSRMSEDEERRYIKESLEALKKAAGQSPNGWFGPEYGESQRTPSLLAEAGVRYVCDWANDEQPYAMKVSKGQLYALPIAFELDDVNAMFVRTVPITRYVKMVKDTFDVLYKDSAASGRLLVINLRPWFSGQPFRARLLDQAFAHIASRRGVWAATGSRIVDWFRGQDSSRRR